ncbi:hypothetical protein Bbelb_172790 [Branchiostoma belcheri]|nr:hypothetical protein Bbelb_172790 [Branchiostoma belcheri]
MTSVCTPDERFDMEGAMISDIISGEKGKKESREVHNSTTHLSGKPIGYGTVVGVSRSLAITTAWAGVQANHPLVLPLVKREEKLPPGRSPCLPRKSDNRGAAYFCQSPRLIRLDQDSLTE